MPVTLYQADGVLVPPVADARLYEMLSGGAVGIVQGCEITSLGGNQLQITSGWGVCLGRVFSIDQETISATTSSGGEVTGRLLLAIDVSNGATPIAFVTQAQTSLPALVQEDINLDGNIYQIPLATYNIGELSISDLRTVYPTANVSGVGLYTHSKSGTVHEFTGTGANGRAKMTADVQAGDTFTVNGAPVTAYMGADSAVDAMAGSAWNGKWISFITEGGVISFAGGAEKAERVIDVTVSGGTLFPPQASLKLHKLGRLLWFETVGSPDNSPVEDMVTVNKNEYLTLTLSEPINKDTVFFMPALMQASYTRFGSAQLFSTDGRVFKTKYVFTDTAYYARPCGFIAVEADA